LEDQVVDGSMGLKWTLGRKEEWFEYWWCPFVVWPEVNRQSQRCKQKFMTIADSVCDLLRQCYAMLNFE
jgi:hypothetical protein